MRRWFAAAALAGALLFAHDVISTKLTWSREVSRIVYARCVSCHRDGGSAFPLTTYAAVRPWAKAIKEEVLERRMPPWGAVKGFGDFTGDLSLSQEQIEVIAEWVEGGAPEGDPALLPKLAPAPIAAAPTGGRIAVNGSITLASETVILAIEPSADVTESARITAEQPDGAIRPMLWAYRYKRVFAHPFIYREPIELAAGTVIRSSPEIPFVLVVRQNRVTSAR